MSWNYHHTTSNRSVLPGWKSKWYKFVIWFGGLLIIAAATAIILRGVNG